MRTCLFITLLLLTSLNFLFGQVNLNGSILEFNADCSEPTAPEDSITEFTLINFSIDNKSTALNFKIHANCGQKQMGKLSISGDTLTIIETDVRIVESETHYETDSLGNELEVTTTTQVEDYTFCDCLVNFNYKFSSQLANLKFLTFHERTFELARTK